MNIEDAQLKELRDRWEGNDTVIFSRRGLASSRLGEILVIMIGDNDDPENYQVLRYFKIDNIWEVSYDFEGALNEAINKIVDLFQ
jgi:hypothetical protein